MVRVDLDQNTDPKQHIDMAKQTGIYVIRNLVNGRVYVGSAVDIISRWGVHEVGLESGKHFNRHLLRAWKQYGPEAFEFSILELCEKNTLAEREQYWMDLLEAVKLGYNQEPTARSPLGRKWKASSKRKASLSANISANTPEQKQMRSDRASRQHAEGKLGQATWKPGTAKRIGRKNKIKLKQNWADLDKRAKYLQALRTADRTYQSSFMKSLGSEEMARRAKVYWGNLSAEERRAHAQKATSGRKDVQRKRALLNKKRGTIPRVNLEEYRASKQKEKS